MNLFRIVPVPGSVCGNRLADRAGAPRVEPAQAPGTGWPSPGRGRLPALWAL